MYEISTISGIRCYEVNGVAYLNLETVARGLGFTTVATSGNEVVRWQRVHKYLCELGVATSCNGSDYRSMCPEYIPENIFYRLAMKAKNETAEKFQAWVVDEVIPAIRRTGSYSVKQPPLPSPADYLKAAQIVSRCTDKRLPVVLSLLEAGGIHVDVPVERAEPVALVETAEPKKRKDPPRIPNKYTEQYTLTKEQRDAMADEALDILWNCPMTVEEMAALTGIGRVNLSQIRHGHRRAGPDRARIIIEVLKPYMKKEAAAV